MNNPDDHSGRDDPKGSKSPQKISLSREEIKQLAELRVLAIDHETTSEKTNEDDIFSINFRGHIIKHLPANSVRIFLHRHPEISREIGIKNMYSEERWIPLLDHESFQDKNSFVPEDMNQTNSSNYFHILKNGQKEGPHTIKEVALMLKRYQLIVTDMVSSDGGHTWRRLATLNEFDRREFNRETMLPVRPQFKNNNNENNHIPNDFKGSDKSAGETDSLVELAHMGMSTDKKNKDEDIFISEKDFVEEAKGYKYLLILFIFFVGGISLTLNDKNIKKEKIVKNKSKVKSQSTAQTKRSTVKKKKRTATRKRPVINKRPLSFRTNTIEDGNIPLVPTPPAERDESINYNLSQKRPNLKSRRRKLPKRRSSPYDEYPGRDRDLEDEYDEEYPDEENYPPNRGLRKKRILKEFLDDYDN